MSTTTPVVMFVYNRPSQTAEVLRAVARARPAQLFVVADGPADSSEEAACSETRMLFEELPWKCELRTRYANRNQGLRHSIATGLRWVFGQVEQAIILEDDCVPAPAFFRYCDELLDRYRDDLRVMEIAGGNFQFGRRRTTASYYFSKYAGVYGWATWGRAFRHFDESISAWPDLRESELLRSVTDSPVEYYYWRRILDRIHDGRLTDLWSAQWSLAMWSQSGLSAVPEVNLITNIGFGSQSTHTRDARSRLGGIPLSDLGEIEHPLHIHRSYAADRYLFNTAILTPHIAGILTRGR